MTPDARVQTAAEILDRIAAGEVAERALTTWARGARFAGSKDRAAVRDHVFDALRRWRSASAAGGGASGRHIMLGLLRLDDADPDTLFTGTRHGPAPLTEEERSGGAGPEGHDLWDLPDWLCARLDAAYGAEAEAVATALRVRAPVTLRVNTLKADVTSAVRALADEGIETAPNPLAPCALTVTANARRVAQCTAYGDGRVELQDAASQAVVDLLPLAPGARVLDLCAGGGGKALAIAARLGGGPVEAWDADPGRMRDLPPRANRAGADIRILRAPQDAYDLVLTDVPCSGSGAWRRTPEEKWRLSPERLVQLQAIQDGILDRAADLLAPGGTLAYATCSILPNENDARIDAFLDRRPGWRSVLRRQFLPGPDGDGFFTAHLMHA
ncbi:Ribosomal RNA small subunit methyltransferase B [Roseivivax jejudonensis]|uniref:Ribosomal RNA small subunit methyltransferase B n=1 Tax=Roseivivax jejudonensis TaxID=1529041 RepID=A0A1X6YPL0_9RHOB|nr:RsmB/NOP family class I SAM-dependent RNA methyltransferase [Roseivivax jejudonensis]SLN27445.1 Ribosomal RNA small subunit methyltransferase B [Roseivivax jejudonensis]